LGIDGHGSDPLMGRVEMGWIGWVTFFTLGRVGSGTHKSAIRFIAVMNAGSSRLSRVHNVIMCADF